MKKLTKIRLINWHYLVDETIELNGSALITGQNAAGKSTILDAIQFVLTVSSNNFNKAAHEEAKRNLTGYVRCKTGKEGNPYLRTGSVTTYVILEFFETVKNRRFIIGACIDSIDETSKCKVLWFMQDNASIEKLKLIDENNCPYNIDRFKRISGEKIKAFKTNEEARTAFHRRMGLGGMDSKFTGIIPKALAFKPIKEVKEFVYSYILDKKEINIETLRENVRTLVEFEKVLEDIKLRIECLLDISKSYEEIKRLNERIDINKYIISRATMDEINLTIGELQNKVAALNSELIMVREEISSISSELEDKTDMVQELQRTILKDDNFIALQRIDAKIEELKRLLLTERDKLKKFDTAMKTERIRASKIISSGLGVRGIKEFMEVTELLSLKTSSDYENEKDNVNGSINVLVTYKNELSEAYSNSIKEAARLEDKLKNTSEDIGKVSTEIAQLETRKLIYPSNTIKLKEALSYEFKKMKMNVEPRIFSELLEFTDDTWRNAVEGYLNTQRFNLIVEPEYYDEALRIYDRVKKEKQIHSVGLVNTGKLMDFDENEAGSLAAVVSSNNVHARRYANMILGKVVRCEDVNELKKHKVSITKSCMLYQNFTARQINPEVYRVPYIGSQAYIRQLELKKEELESLKLKLSELKAQEKGIKDLAGILRTNEIDYIIDNISVREKTVEFEHKLKAEQENRKKIDNSTIIELELEIKQLKEAMKVLNVKKDEKNKKEGFILNEVSNTLNNIEDKNKIVIFKSKELEKLEAEIQSVLQRAISQYETENKQKNYTTIKENFTLNLKNLTTRLDNENKEFTKLQTRYNKEFNFGGGYGYEEAGAYLYELANLQTSKFTEYEEKIRNSKKNCEEEFREHFLSRLKENIDTARGEFKRLNDALKGVFFGDDSYEFTYAPAKKYDKYYNMIMDDTNLFDGLSLFSSSYAERHKEAMEELFDKLTLNNEDSNKTLEEFTDFRNYMDYDIRIKHKDGSKSLFSKVCREKSGGETQTPYYVAIAASFIQLYSGKAGETIGLVLFDEAFDKMDDSRIDGMMNFLNALELQIIMATPPQKMEIIGPKIKTTLVVIKEEDFCFVEEYYVNEGL